MAVRHQIEGDGAWLTTGEIARLLKVDPKTVARWAKDGRIPAGYIIRTLGGHRRYSREFFEQHLNGGAS